LLASHIITKPPHRLAMQFVGRAKELRADKAALLLALGFLYGASRYELFSDRSFPLRAIYVFAEPLGLLPGKANPVPAAWFVWDRAAKHRPFVDWIPPKSK
jgi:hypothetical protein